MKSIDGMTAEKRPSAATLMTTHLFAAETAGSTGKDCRTPNSTSTLAASVVKEIGARIEKGQTKTTSKRQYALLAAQVKSGKALKNRQTSPRAGFVLQGLNGRSSGNSGFG